MTSLMSYSILNAKWFASLIGSDIFSGDAFFIIGVQGVFPQFIACGPFLRCVAQQIHQTRAHILCGLRLVELIHENDGW